MPTFPRTSLASLLQYAFPFLQTQSILPCMGENPAREKTQALTQSVRLLEVGQAHTSGGVLAFPCAGKQGSTAQKVLACSAQNVSLVNCDVLPFFFFNFVTDALFMEPAAQFRGAIALALQGISSRFGSCSIQPRGAFS